MKFTLTKYNGSIDKIGRKKNKFTGKIEYYVSWKYKKKSPPVIMRKGDVLTVYQEIKISFWDLLYCIIFKQPIKSDWKTK